MQDDEGDIHLRILIYPSGYFFRQQNLSAYLLHGKMKQIDS